MLGRIKRIFKRDRPAAETFTYGEARDILAESSNGDQVVVFLNPLIWHLGSSERQKGSPLTKAEVYAVRDQAYCMIMTRAKAKTFYSVFDAEFPVPRIKPERVWEGWQKIRNDVDQYMPE